MEAVLIAHESDPLDKIEEEYSDSDIAEIEFRNNNGSVNLTEEVKQAIPDLKPHDFSVTLNGNVFRLVIHPPNTKVRFDGSRMKYTGDETEEGFVIDNIGFEKGTLYIEVDTPSGGFSLTDFEEIRLQTR